MIDDGFRLYMGEDGDLRLDQIVAGSGVYPLELSEADHKLALGYYDENFKLIRSGGGGNPNHEPAGSPDGGQFTSGGGGEGATSESHFPVAKGNASDDFKKSMEIHLNAIPKPMRDVIGKIEMSAYKSTADDSLFDDSLFASSVKVQAAIYYSHNKVSFFQSSMIRTSAEQQKVTVIHEMFHAYDRKSTVADPKFTSVWRDDLKKISAKDKTRFASLISRSEAYAEISANILVGTGSNYLKLFPTAVAHQREVLKKSGII